MRKLRREARKKAQERNEGKGREEGVREGERKRRRRKEGRGVSEYLVMPICQSVFKNIYIGACVPLALYPEPAYEASAPPIYYQELEQEQAYEW